MLKYKQMRQLDSTYAVNDLPDLPPLYSILLFTYLFDLCMYTLSNIISILINDVLCLPNPAHQLYVIPIMESMINELYCIVKREPEARSPLDK